MSYVSRHRWPTITTVAIAAVVTLCSETATAQQPVDNTALSIELVDPTVLRVCADPRNLPFSNEKGEGFENKIAELQAEKLHKQLDYVFFPHATGVVRMTL